MAKKIDVRCNKTGVIFDVSLKRLYVDDIKKLTNDQIAVLTSGDEVIKQDSSGHHTYVVSYKKEGTGMCLTYTDATYVETVSYDLIDGKWTFNSIDTGGSGGGSGGTTYQAGTGIDIEDDTISIDTDVVATKNMLPKTYQYTFVIEGSQYEGWYYVFTFQSNDFTPPISGQTFDNTIASFIGTSGKKVQGVITTLGEGSSPGVYPTFALYNSNSEKHILLLPDGSPIDPNDLILSFVSQEIW